MLQRGIELPSLDVTYITSLSFYILLLFGLRGVFMLVFRSVSPSSPLVSACSAAAGTDVAASTTHAMAQPQSRAAASSPGLLASSLSSTVGAAQMTVRHEALIDGRACRPGRRRSMTRS